jgi:predicted DNA-binding transcriptional regulator AlpA
VANANPDTRGLGKGPRVFYDKSQVYGFLHHCVRRLPYRAPVEVPDTPDLISKSDVIEMIGVTYARLWQMEKSGQFPRRIRIVRGGRDAAAE